MAATTASTGVPSADDFAAPRAGDRRDGVRSSRELDRISAAVVQPANNMEVFNLHAGPKHGGVEAVRIRTYGGVGAAPLCHSVYPKDRAPQRIHRRMRAVMAEVLEAAI